MNAVLDLVLGIMIDRIVLLSGVYVAHDIVRTGELFLIGGQM